MEKGMTEEALKELERFLDEHEKGGLDSGEYEILYSYQLAIELIKILQKDLEAFKKLTEEEQEKVFWEYKNEMDVLSDEELDERYKKYF